MAAWSALLSEDKKDFTAKRYSRLLAVESNEIENVFLLGGESLVKLVRVGFYTGAIDRVLNSPSGKPDPSTIVTILEYFAQVDLVVYMNYGSSYIIIGFRDLHRYTQNTS